MAKVLLFPQKKEIPKGIEEHLGKIAKEYVETLAALIVLLDVDISNQKEYEETLIMVQDSFTKGIHKAIEEMDEG